MDLVYLSDAFSHMSVRNAFSWSTPDNEYELSVAEKHRQANSRRKKQEQKKVSQPCPICLENKRRKLGSYIRQKSQDDSAVIREEEEEGNQELQVQNTHCHRVRTA